MADVKSCSPIFHDHKLRVITVIAAAEMTLPAIISCLWALSVFTLKPIPYADECLPSDSPQAHSHPKCPSLLL